MKRVLIADDSNFILVRLQQMLLGMEDVEVVGSFNNGTDALTAIHALKPDIAILDNKMPGLNGIDIIREITKEDSTMTLVLLTFYTDIHYRQKAMSAGADYFFSKSEDFEKIPAVISQLINNSNL